MSADTSVPEQWEAGLGTSDAGLPDAVMRDSPAGVAFFGTDLRFAWVNPALARLFGRDEGTFVGRELAEVWPHPDAALAEAVLRQVVAEDRPATERLVTGSSAGELGCVFYWFPVHDSDGCVMGAGAHRGGGWPGIARG